MRTLRYGLVGFGMMGYEHLRNVQALNGVEVVAASDPDEGQRRLAGDLGVPAGAVYADHRTMLA